MTRTKWTGAWVIAAVAVVVATWAAGVAGRAPAASNQAAQKTSVEALLGQALQQEEVEGNLRAAISTYQKVIAAVGVTKAQAARAQLRIGGCYERLGMTEARKAYEAVVANYGDQEAAVKVARARLAALGNVSAAAAGSALSGPTAKSLWKKPGWFSARLSPDGRSVAFIDEATARLWIRDLLTGTDRLLVDVAKERQWCDFPLQSRWSPDGTRIAFDWFTQEGTGGTSEIRVADVKTGAVSTYEPTRKLGASTPLDWSPDGKRVLITVPELTSGTRREMPAWLSLADGAVTPLRGVSCPCGAAVSPDGTRIAFGTRTPQNEIDTDIVITKADGSSPRLLLGGPAEDRPLAWTPDGTGLVIRSRKSGRDGMWLLSVDGNALKGSPQLLRDEVADTAPQGLSRAGALLYTTGARQDDLKLATVDLDSGRTSDIQTLEAAGGATNMQVVSWSPDGHRLAYIARVGGRWALTIRTDDRPRDQVYFFDFDPIAAGSWSPDGRSLFIPGGVQRSRTMSFYRVDLGSGEATALFPPIASSSKEGSTFIFAASADGKSVYKQKLDATTRLSSLWRQDVATGSETELFRSAGPAGMFKGAPSPDGKWLPFMLNPFDGGERQVMVLPLGGGAARRLCSVASTAMTLAWSPDSQWLLFTQRSGAQDDAVTEVWQVPVTGGSARKLGIQAPNLMGLGVHPDGKHIAYGNIGVPNEEVWLLENFLPKPAKK